MGRYPRRRQKRVGAKLRQIRDALGLSQTQIARRLRLPTKFTRTIISNYENNEREPPLFVLLAYAREAGICLDVIVDDKIDLPTSLPGTPVHGPIKITSGKRGSKKV
jgi:transcriptional regulator with XRE-family HTH domain